MYNNKARMSKILKYMYYNFLNTAFLQFVVLSFFFWMTQRGGYLVEVTTL